MNPRSKHQTWKTGAVILLAGSLFALPAGLFAQETEAPEAPTPEQVAAEPEALPEDIVELSPFVVTGETDEGYRATSTLAGTRLRTEMKDIGSSISIVNKEFIQDTQSVDIQDVLLYTPNTEVGGLAGNYSAAQDSGAGNMIPEQHRDQQSGGHTRIRGLAGADLTRNYFITNLPFDTYNVDRIEVQRGANSALFGLGSPGGIVNHTLVTPDFNQKNRNRIRLETDQYGTFRGSFRTNQVLVDDVLAVNIAGLYSDKQFEQKEAFELDKRLYAAFDWQVMEGIHVYGNIESTDRESARVDFVPPNDGITPWLAMGSPTVDSPAAGGNLYRRIGDYGNDQNGTPVNNYRFWGLAAPGSSSGYVSLYNDPNYAGPTSGNQVFARAGYGLPNPYEGVTSGEWMNLIPRTISNVINYTGAYPDGTPVPTGSAQYFGKGFVTAQILDRSIFDYRKHLFTGGGSQQYSDWLSWQGGVSGVWFENRVGVDLTYSYEKFNHKGYNSLQGAENRMIYIDPNRYLIGTTDGTADGPLVPNPGFGLPTMGGLWGGNKGWDQLHSTRLQAFGELKATDFMEEGIFESILGRLKVTALLEKRGGAYLESYGRDKVDYNAVANAAAGGVIRDWQAYVYYTGSVYTLPSEGSSSQYLSATSLSDFSGANIGGVPFGNDRIRPPKTMTWQGWNSAGYDAEDTEWEGSFVNFSAPTWTLDDGEGMPSAFYAGKGESSTDSTVAVGQWYIWDDTLVLMGSWRNDQQSSAGVGAPGSSTFLRAENLLDPNYLAGPQELSEDADEDTTSWSVMLHTPQFIKDWLPWGTEVSLYASEASNFVPTSGSVTILNDPIPAVTGTTEESGIIVSTMHGKLVMRLNFYETAINNKRFDVGGVSANEGILLNLVRQLDNPANVAQGFTQSDVEAVLPPQGVIDLNQWVPDWANFDAATNRNSSDNGTQDFVSDGYEFELTYNPTTKWTMMLSVGSQETVTSNTYPVLQEYAADFVTPTWVNSSFAQNYFMNEEATTTLAETATLNILQPVQRGVLQDGFPQIEQRQLRINFNTSYNLGPDSFMPDFLGSVTVGGGCRWQDKAGVGWEVSQNALGDYVQDVTKPIYAGEIFNLDLFWRSQWILDNEQSIAVQLNITDALATGDLIPIYANPDGSKMYRFTEGTMFRLMGTWEF